MSTSSDSSFCFDKIVASERLSNEETRFFPSLVLPLTIVLIVAVQREYRGLFALSVEFIHFVLFADVSIGMQSG